VAEHDTFPRQRGFRLRPTKAGTEPATISAATRSAGHTTGWFHWRRSAARFSTSRRMYFRLLRI